MMTHPAASVETAVLLLTSFFYFFVAFVSSFPSILLPKTFIFTRHLSGDRLVIFFYVLYSVFSEVSAAGKQIPIRCDDGVEGGQAALVPPSNRIIAKVVRA